MWLVKRGRGFRYLECVGREKGVEEGEYDIGLDNIICEIEEETLV